MHSFAHHDIESGQTQGHVLNWGWRYDLMLWWGNLMSRGKWNALQQRIIEMAHLQKGEAVLDRGCGTGTLALEAYTRVGAQGHVSGIDPGPKQIARARYKAARRGLPV